MHGRNMSLDRIIMQGEMNTKLTRTLIVYSQLLYNHHFTLVVDMSKISVNLKDTKRASSVQEFGEIAGGLPENIVSANTVDEESSGKRPLSPFTALFSEGAGGDAVLASTIKEVKAIYRDALRASGICLKTYRNAQ